MADPTVSRERRERKERRRRVEKQRKAANVRAKYGPSRKPSPVVVKSLATGEVVNVLDQDRFRSHVCADPVEDLAHAAGFASYAAYLASPAWRELRERALSRDGYRCQRCGSKKRLQVHHMWYLPLTSDDVRHLRTLCTRCHQQRHR